MPVLQAERIAPTQWLTKGLHIVRRARRSRSGREQEKCKAWRDGRGQTVARACQNEGLSFFLMTL
jgi:hypothetical protein